MAASSSASRWLMNEPGRRLQIEVVSLSSRCTSVIESRLAFSKCDSNGSKAPGAGWSAKPNNFAERARRRMMKDRRRLHANNPAIRLDA
jgi:hypothetical protein